MKIMVVEDEHSAHSKNEASSVKIEMERLPLTLTEETVGNTASMQSLFKVGSPKKNCTAASKATGEEKNKVRVALALPTNQKAVRTEAVYRSNTYHRPGESRMKTRHQKLDYSKVQAKVNTWR
jgi:hypothetical protein